MKFSATVKKTLSAFLILLLMAGVYGAVISLCNQYLRKHEMLAKPSQFILGAFMFIGFYLIYRWFSKRIDSISKLDNKN